MGLAIMTQPSLLDLPSPQPTVESPVARERKRLNAAALRVLSYLQFHHGCWCSNVELCQKDIGGMRATGRMSELRAEGWDIEKRHVKDGCWEYRLLGLKR